MEQHRRITVAVGLAMLVDASLYLAVLPLLPYYAERFDLGTFGVAILLASFPLSAPIVALGCVPLVPRVGARRIALVSASLMVVATLLVAVAPSAAVLVVGRFLQGVASATVWTSSMAWVTHNAPDDRRGRESGIVMGLFAVGSVLGPGVGALAAWSGPLAAFLGVAVAGVVALVATALAPAGAPVPVGVPLAPSLGATVRSPLARAAILMSVVDPLAFATMDLLIPLDLAERGISTTVLALTFATGAALGGVAGPIGGRLVDRFGPGRVAFAMSAAIAASPAVLIAGPPPWVQLALLIVLFPLFAVATAAMYPLAAAGADAASVPHGAVNGLLGSFWAAGSTVSALGAGALADIGGDALAYAVALALAAPLALLIGRDTRAGGVTRGSRIPATPSR